jgi:hypothetical protein
MVNSYAKVLTYFPFVVIRYSYVQLIICIITGKTGDWMNHFSPELNQRIDDWIEQNLIGSDLKFTTELEHQD